MTELDDTSLKVLIVEPNPDIREMVDLLFSDMGYRTYSAATGKEALSQVRMHTPDITRLKEDSCNLGAFSLL